MRRFTILAATAALAVAGVTYTSPAEAQWRRHGGGVVAGVAAGLLGGAILGSAFSRPAYGYAPVYGYSTDYGFGYGPTFAYGYGPTFSYGSGFGHGYGPTFSYGYAAPVYAAPRRILVRRAGYVDGSVGYRRSRCWIQNRPVIDDWGRIVNYRARRVCG